MYFFDNWLSVAHAYDDYKQKCSPKEISDFLFLLYKQVRMRMLYYIYIYIRNVQTAFLNFSILSKMNIFNRVKFLILVIYQKMSFCCRNLHRPVLPLQIASLYWTLNNFLGFANNIYLWKFGILFFINNMAESLGN